MNTTKSTTGTTFALRAAKYFNIGTRTRRQRDGQDVIRHIMEQVTQAGLDGYFSPETTAAFYPAVHALHAWNKHVDGYRLSGDLMMALRAVTPYQFLKMIGRMIDDGAVTSAEVEAWFIQNRNAITGKVQWAPRQRQVRPLGNRLFMPKS